MLAPRGSPCFFADLRPLKNYGRICLHSDVRIYGLRIYSPVDIKKLEQEVELLHNRVCYALSDPKRICILYLLAEGGRFVNEIAEVLDTPQPTVSRHLRVLRERELVHAERQGTAVCYSLVDKRIIEALDLMRGIVVSQLTAGIDLAQSLDVG